MGSTDSTAAVEPTEAQKYADGLREIAGLIDAHPDVTPSSGEYFCCFVTTREELLGLTGVIGGSWEKEIVGDDDTFFRLVRRFGPHRLAIYTARENVCERVVVGKVTVMRPADDAPMVGVEEDVVQWVCPPSLLAGVER